MIDHSEHNSEITLVNKPQEHYCAVLENIFMLETVNTFEKRKYAYQAIQNAQ